MKKLLYWLIGIVLLLSKVEHGFAQESDSAFKAFEKEYNNGYESYVKKEAKNFSRFKREADSAYYALLKEQWKYYESLKPKKSLVKPKPSKIPSNDTVGLEKPVSDIPIVIKKTDPEIIDNPFQPNKPIEDENATINFNRLDFYGNLIKAPLKDFLTEWPVLVGEITNISIANYWAKASACKLEPWITFLQQTRNTTGGGDYALFQVIVKLSNYYYANDENTAKLFSWYLLLQNGYDVKVGYNKNRIYLLVNSGIELFGKSFYTINKKNYYLLEVEKETVDFLSICDKDFKLTNSGINLAVIPALSESDVVSRNYTFNYMGKTYSIPLSYSKSHIAYFNYYPQMSISAYSISQEGKWFDEKIKESFSPFMQSLSIKEQVSFLLSFVQHAFEYKTDEEQFGREKWDFPEEILYYPYSDCDDRAIFFGYLVRKLTGLKVVELMYPGHVCTAVAFPEGISIEGSVLKYKNKEYVICDPTFIGADIGMQMPQYKGVNPEIFE